MQATLRDEGIAVPRKCGKLHPLHIGPHPPRPKENTADCVPAPQPPIAASTEAKEARKNDCNEEEGSAYWVFILCTCTLRVIV